MNKYEYAKQNGYYIAKNGDAFSKSRKLKLRLKSKTNVYYIFKIRYYGKSVAIAVHRLQAYQKFGNAIFEKDTVVRHLNGNSLDNSVDNISIGTQSDNMMDISREIRTAKAIRATSFWQKFNHEDVFSYYQETHSYKKTMAKFGMTSKGSLHYIIKKLS